MTPTADTTPSIMGRLMPSIMRLRRSNRHYRSRAHVQTRLDDLTRHPQDTNPPKRPRQGVSITTHHEHGWQLHTVTPSHHAARGSVIYLHGGGWMHEAAPQHWALVQQIAKEACVEVILPVYPLVQAGGTAATVTPIVARLAASAQRPLVLMGDSAGGSIALSASYLMKEKGIPADLTVLIAPALDLRMENPEIEDVQPYDPWLVKKGQILLTEKWAGDDREDPILNPFLGDPRGIGELMIFSGTRDILNPDTRLFVEAAANAGADVTYHEQPGHLHVYPLLPTPEGYKARRNIVDAVRRTVSA